MKKYIIIKADTNDADYITSKHLITDTELEIIQPIIKAIKDYTEDTSIKHQKWNFWRIGNNDNPSPKELYVDSGKCTQESLDYFNDFRPHGEHGIHSIESIELLEVFKEQRLL